MIDPHFSLKPGSGICLINPTCTTYTVLTIEEDEVASAEGQGLGVFFPGEKYLLSLKNQGDSRILHIFLRHPGGGPLHPIHSNLGVSENSGKTTKMDGENNGKPY